MESAQVASAVSGALSKAFSGSAVSDALHGFGSFSTKAGAVLTGALTVAANKGMDVIGDLLNTISTTESADMALTTMFTPEFDMDSEAAGEFAKQYIGWINDFAVKTPFGFESALGGARTLVAMGFESTEVLDDMGEGVLRWSGDMAAALGGDATTFNNIILQLGHMKSLGHVMSYQMNALARNGVPAWQAMAEYMNQYGDGLAEAYGLESDMDGQWTVETLRALAREGALSSDLGLDALEWYSNTHYEGMMDKESHTFRGIMMNMSDAIETPIRTLYDTDAWHGFTSALYDMLDPLRNMMTALLPTFELALQRVTPIITGITDKIKDFTAKLESGEVSSEKILGVFEALGFLLTSGPLALGAGGLANFFGDIAEKVEGFSHKATGSFDKVLGSMEKTGKGGLRNVRNFVKKSNEHLQNFGGQLVSGEGFGGKFKKGLNVAGHGFSEFAGGMGDGLKKIGNNFEKLGTRIGKSTQQTIVGPIQDSIGGMSKKLKRSLDDAFDFDMDTKFDSISKSLYGPDNVKPISMGVDPEQEQKRIDATNKRVARSMENLRRSTSSATAGLGLTDTSEFEKYVKENGKQLSRDSRFKKLLDGKAEGESFGKAVRKATNEASRRATIEAKTRDDLMKRAASSVANPDAMTSDTLKRMVGKAGGSIPAPDVRANAAAYKAMETAATNAAATVTATTASASTAATTSVEKAAATTSGSVKAATDSVTKDVAETTAKTTEGTTVASKSTSRLRNAFVKLRSAANTVIGTMGKLTVSTLAFSAACTKAAAAASLSLFAGFSKIMVIGGALIGVLSLVATVAAGMYVAVGGNLGNLGTTIAQTLYQVTGTIAGFLGGMTNAFNTILAEGQIYQFFDHIVPVIRGMRDTIVQLAPEFMSALGQVFTQIVGRVVEVIAEFLPDIVDGAIQLFTGLITGLTTVIEKINTVLPQLVVDLISVLLANIPSLMNAAVSLFTALVDGFVAIVPGIVDQIPLVIAQIGQSLSANKNKLLSGVKKLVKAVANAIPKLLKTLLITVTEFIKEIATTIRQSDGSFFDGFAELIMQMGYALGQMAPNVISALLDLLGALVDKLPSFAGAFFSGAAGLIMNFINGFTGKGDIAVSEVGGIIADMIASIPTHVAEFASAAFDLITGFIGGIVGGRPAIAEEVDGVVSEAVAGFSVGDFFSVAGKWVSDIVAGITGLDDPFGKDIGTLVSGAVTAFGGAVGDFVGVAGKWVSHVISSITGLDDPFGKDIGTLVSGAATAFGGAVADFVGVAGKWVSHIISDLTGLEDPFGKDIGNLVSDVVTAFGGAVSDFVGVAGEWVSHIVSDITGLDDPFGTQIGDLVSGIVTDFGGVVADFAGVAGKWVSHIISDITGLDDPFGTDIGELIPSIVTAFGGAVTDFAGVAGKWVSHIVSDITGLEDPFGADIGKLVSGAVTNFKGVVSDFAGVAGKWVEFVIASITGQQDPFNTDIGTLVSGAVTNFIGVASDFAGVAGKWVGFVIESITGQENPFATDIGTLVSGAVTNFKGVATDWIGVASDWISNVSAGLVDGGEDSIAGKISGIVGDAVDAAKGHGDDWIGAGAAFLGSLGQGIIDGAVGFANGVWMTIDAALTNSPAGALWTAAKQFVSDLATGVQDNLEGLDVIPPYVDDEVAAAFQEDGLDAIASVGPVMTETIAHGACHAANGTAGAAIESAGETLGESLDSGAVDGVLENVGTVEDALAQTGGAAINKFQEVTDTHSPSGVFKQIGGWLIDGLNLGIAKSNPTKNLPEVKQKLTNFFTNSSSWLVSAGNNVVSGFNSGISGRSGTVTTSVNSLKTAATNAMSNSSTLLKGHGNNLASGLAKGVDENAWKVKNAAVGAVDGAKNAIWTGSLWSTGTNLIQGLINGINDKYDELRTTVTGVANYVTSRIGSLWDVGSPSRVAMQLGSFFTQGLAIGLDSERDMLTDSASGVASAAMDAVTSEFAPSRMPMSNMYNELVGSAKYSGPSAEQIAAAMCKQMDGIGVYLNADETSAQLAPSLDRELGRLTYMEV